MQISNLFLDTCVAVKRLQEDEEGDDVRKFLEDKIQHMTTYSIKEFKKSFVRAVIYLEYMIEEGRTIREIYQDISDMKIDKDSNISKLGRRLEILMAMIGNPDKIDDKVLYHLKIWRQGFLTLLFIGKINLFRSLSECTIGDTYVGESSNEICFIEKCKINKLLITHNEQIKEILKDSDVKKDTSLKDFLDTLSSDLNNFDKTKCGKIGDIIIAFDFLGFKKENKSYLFCSYDHHFDILCPILKIKKINPMTEEVISYPT